MPDLHHRIAAVISAYDTQGQHRTGTAVDARSAEWLAQQVQACGLDADLEAFPLERVDPQPSFVEVDGRREDGPPLFDGGFTDADGVTGRVGPLGSDAPIGVTEAAVGGPDAGALYEARRAAVHRVIVAITRGRAPGLAVLNAPAFAAPFGPPVLQVSSEAGAWLLDAAARGATARVVAHAERQPATAFNVVARLAGAEPSLPPLVVMTPRSGWWGCASERGGGIVCWLEVLRALRAVTPERPVWFVATSGHELGHLGLEAFIARRPGLDRDAQTWLHFGANIGAAAEGGRLAASDGGLEALALDAIARHNARPVPAAARGWVPNGEAHNIHIAGGRYLSLIGANARFHLEADHWPDAVDVNAVAAYACAFAEVAVALAYPRE